jgi:cytolysin (calcineurin-like family phosphatase)
MILYKEGDSEYKNGQYRYVHDPAILHNHFPVFAEIKAAYGEKSVPESGPDNRVDWKSNKIHSCHTCGQGDQVTHYRNKTAYKNCRIAVFFKKTLGSGKIVMV